MFEQIFDRYNWDKIEQSIYDKSIVDVERALNKQGKDLTLEDFKSLISPVAAPYLEYMAQLSHRITKQRFGNTIQMYLPMYLSNKCQNICTYCGFSADNKIRRITLSKKQIFEEIKVIKQMGYEHILLVTGEANGHVGMTYFKRVLEWIRPYFSNISMEVQPLQIADYISLNNHGVHAILVYQETYHKEGYKKHHPRGKKSDFYYRVNTPDRVGKSGIHKIGMGVLIGLEDWRTDSFFTALHLQYLERVYWQTKYAISFPRLRPFSGGLMPKVTMSDAELVQLICAYRLLNSEVELSLSTRETQVFRNHAISLGITSLSAGSKTNPGGYRSNADSLEQFEISDERTPEEMIEIIRSKGYEPVWKDWDVSLQSSIV